jgi:O-antigen ligase
MSTSRTEGEGSGSVAADDDISGRALKLLLVVASIMPLGSIYLPLGLTWLALAVAIALAVIQARRGRYLPFVNGRLLVVFALFLGWSALSITWSIDPGRSTARLFPLFLVLACIFVMMASVPAQPGVDSRRLAVALAAGIGVALAVVLVERLTGTPLMKAFGHDPVAMNYGAYVPFKRGVSVLAVLVWPALLGLFFAGFRWRLWSLGLAVLAAIALIEDWTVLLAYLGGGAVFFLALLGRRPVLHLLRIAAALWVLAIPVLFQIIIPKLNPAGMVDHVTSSVTHRLYIWEFATGKTLERPLTGYGIDTTRAVPGGRDKVLLATKPKLHWGEKISLHTHNVPVQLWLELGIVGALLAAALVWLLFSIPLVLADRVAAAALAGMLVTGFGILNGAYGAWQVWWQAGFALAAMFMVSMIRSVGGGPGPR